MLPQEICPEEKEALHHIEEGSCIVAHGSLPARAGRGGYPVMVYRGGQLVFWKRAFLLDRLYNRGLLDLYPVWCPVTRDWDCLYVRTWEDPLDPKSTNKWDYRKASTKNILRFALVSLKAYNEVANIAKVAANARNYCVKEKRDAQEEVHVAARRGAKSVSDEEEEEENEGLSGRGGAPGTAGPAQGPCPAPEASPQEEAPE